MGDTIADVEEGLNAGMWVVAFTRCGNEVGLSQEGMQTASAEAVRTRVQAATVRLREAGAHYAVDGPWACLPVIEEIRRRIRAGESP